MLRPGENNCEAFKWTTLAPSRKEKTALHNRPTTKIDMIDTSQQKPETVAQQNIAGNKPASSPVTQPITAEKNAWTKKPNIPSQSASSAAATVAPAATLLPASTVQNPRGANNVFSIENNLANINFSIGDKRHSVAGSSNQQQQQPSSNGAHARKSFSSQRQSSTINGSAQHPQSSVSSSGNQSQQRPLASSSTGAQQPQQQSVLAGGRNGTVASSSSSTATAAARLQFGTATNAQPAALESGQLSSAPRAPLSYAGVATKNAASIDGSQIASVAGYSSVVTGSVPKKLQDDINKGIIAPTSVQFGSLNSNASPFKPKNTTDRPLPFLPPGRVNAFDEIQRVRSAPPELSEQDKLLLLQQQQQHKQNQPLPPSQVPIESRAPHSTAGETHNFENVTSAPIQAMDTNKPPVFVPSTQPVPSLNATGGPSTFAQPFVPQPGFFGYTPPMMYGSYGMAPPPQGFQPSGFPSAIPSGAPGVPIPVPMPISAAPFVPGAPIVPMPVMATTTTSAAPIFKAPPRERKAIKIVNPDTKEEIKTEAAEAKQPVLAPAVHDILEPQVVPSFTPVGPVEAAKVEQVKLIEVAPPVETDTSTAASSEVPIESKSEPELEPTAVTPADPVRMKPESPQKPHQTVVEAPAKSETFTPVQMPGKELPIKEPEVPPQSSSPIPPEKRIYDLKFMLTFKEICKEKPAELSQNMECLLGSESSSRRESMVSGRNDKFSSGSRSRGSDAGYKGGRGGYSKGGPPPKLPPGLSGRPGSVMDRGSSRRMSSKGGRYSDRDHAPSVAPDVGLSKAENKWVPVSMMSKDKMDALDILDKEIKSLLNKLTIENFEKILLKFLALDLSSIEAVNHLAAAIYEKGIEEMKFSGVYAKMFLALINKLPDFSSEEQRREAEGKTRAVYLRKALIDLCQTEFFKSTEWAADLVASKITDDMTPEQIAEHTEKEVKRRKMKRRTLGNIRFIGELFNYQLLPEKIPHECVKNLLVNIETPEEEDLESVCQFLETVGSKMDTDKAKGYMDTYFERLETVSRDTRIPSRIRFKVKDVIELRRRNWIARERQQQMNAGPMKLKDVQKEMDRIASEQAKTIRAREQERSRESAGKRASGRNSDGGGWNVVKPTKEAPTKPPSRERGSAKNTQNVSILTRSKKEESEGKANVATEIPTKSGNVFDALAVQDSSDNMEVIADSEEPSAEVLAELPKNVMEEDVFKDYFERSFIKEYVSAVSNGEEAAFDIILKLRSFADDDALPDIMTQAYERLIQEISTKAFKMLSDVDCEKQLHAFVLNFGKVCRFELLPDLEGFLEKQIIEMPENTIDIPGLDNLLGALVGELLINDIIGYDFIMTCINELVNACGDFTPRLRPKSSTVDAPCVARFYASMVRFLSINYKDSVVELLTSILANEASRLYNTSASEFKLDDTDTQILKNPWWGTDAELLNMIPDASIAGSLNQYGILEFLAPSISILCQLDKELSVEITSQSKELVDISKVSAILESVPASTKTKPAFLRSIASFFCKHIQRVVSFQHASDGSKSKQDLMTVQMKKWFPMLKVDIAEEKTRHQLQAEILFTLQDVGSFGEFKGIEQYFKYAFEILYDVEAVHDEAFQLWQQNSDRQLDTKELALVRGAREFLKSVSD